MASIVVMLSSYSVTLSSPQRPRFFLHSRTESNAPINGLEANQSTSKSKPLSEASITYSYEYARLTNLQGDPKLR
ncbi:hypothetical protein SLA2020_350640 [Shorea laevis]